MGALHDGHVSLMLQCVAQNNVSIVSLFVNPTQFNNASDLLHYPRQEEKDFLMIEKAGVDAVFAPSAEEMYPMGFETSPMPGTFITTVFEGASRPGHFDGVATIVRKLLDVVRPHRAYFGEKDFQQLAVVRQLVERDKPAVEIVPCPTIRESDGLAMSSRNVRLTPAERVLAPGLYAAMTKISLAIRNGDYDRAKANSIIRGLVDDGFVVEYLVVVDARSFVELAPEKARPGNRIIAAAWLGQVRLIDNREV